MDINDLLQVMSKLRDPADGCPWDREQDFASIAPYTIEEAYEVADAVDRGDFGALREELGDLLLQVVFHARMAEERGEFTFADVVRSIVEKLVRRHPHVFGDETISSADEQRTAWELLKAREQGRDINGPRPILSGVSQSLPALARAAKLGRRAGAVGFDWTDVDGVVAKVREELAEVEDAVLAGPQRLEEEVGDLLFAVANLARRADIDPEEALRKANGKFERRFGQVEAMVRAAHRAWPEFTPGELDGFWRQAKARE